MTRYVIVGNGAAGVTAAETIRQNDPFGEIVVLSAERYPMYSRPGLAYVLTGDIPPQQIFARTLDWYDDLAIQLRFGRVCALDTVAQQVYLEDGTAVTYDRLLIATGARAVPAPFPGNDLDGIVYLDSMDSTRHLLQKARRAKRAVVVGGGITALELAEGMARRGVETHYLVRRDRLWGRVFNQREAALLEHAIRHHGVQIHYNTEVASVQGNWRNKVTGVTLKQGEQMACQLVGVAIGVRPQIRFAHGTPLEIDRGILVNEYLETRVPNLFAAGDCAQIYDRWSGDYLLDSLWPSAVASGRVAGLNMAGGRQVYSKGVPFNACLLFGLHVTSIGQVNPHSAGPDGVTHAQLLSRGASEVWFTFPRSYHSAWSEKGDSSLRLTFDGDRLAGAMIIGAQHSADNLRTVIESGVDASSLLPHVADRDALVAAIDQVAETAERGTLAP